MEAKELPDLAECTEQFEVTVGGEPGLGSSFLWHKRECHARLKPRGSEAGTARAHTETETEKDPTHRPFRQNGSFTPTRLSLLAVSPVAGELVHSKLTKGHGLVQTDEELDRIIDFVRTKLPK